MSSPDRSVAPDGSPVEVYRVVPLEPEFSPLLQAIIPRASVLDLGCGAGRLANHLAARGHRVLGVDASPEMLEHVDARVTTHCSAIQDLRLPDSFDAVVLASHFVNVADQRLRLQLLRSASRHLGEEGSLYLQRYDPGWDPAVGARSSRIGGLDVTTEVLRRKGKRFDARTTYRIGMSEWRQHHTAQIVDDEDLTRALATVGLRLRSELDTSRRWVEAVHER